MEDVIADKLCKECKQKYQEGKFFWMCEVCRKIFEPKDELGLNHRKE